METIEGAPQTPDEYWRVEIVKHGPSTRWYRITHAHTVVADRASIATVQRILGDAYPTLQPVQAGEGENGAA